jgi:hypothetical protein
MSAEEDKDATPAESGDAKAPAAKAPAEKS